MKKEAVAILFCLCVTSEAATTGVPETFGDGGAPASGSWSSNDGSVVPDAGEAGVGDHAMLYIAANQPPRNNGFHLLHPIVGGTPNPVFLGDYLAAGVTAVRFNARHSGAVDGDDFLIWQSGFNVDNRGDANGDGITDGDDFLIWQNQFGSANGSGAIVPEPASFVLLLVTLVGVLFLGRQQ